MVEMKKKILMPDERNEKKKLCQMDEMKKNNFNARWTNEKFDARWKK